LGHKIDDPAFINRQNVTRQRDAGGFNGDDPFWPDQQVNACWPGFVKGGGFHVLIQSDSGAFDNRFAIPLHAKIARFLATTLSLADRGCQT
jgi:hypothetical protein